MFRARSLAFDVEQPKYRFRCRVARVEVRPDVDEFAEFFDRTFLNAEPVFVHFAREDAK